MGKLSQLPPYTTPALTDSVAGIQSPGSAPTDVQIPIANLLGVWQSWTPVWTNLTIGTTGATTSYQYVKIGKTVFWNLAVKLGTGCIMGSNPQFTLPTTMAFTPANANSFNLGIGGMTVSGGSAVFYARAQMQTNTTAVVVWETISGSGIEFGGVGSTSPFTWVAGSCIDLSGCYQSLT